MKLSPQEIKAKGTITGLRISAVDGAAFLDAIDITSLTPDKGLTLHTGAVTQANSKISAAAGVSFIDFSAGTDLTDHLGKYLVYKDSAGRQLRGWIKAAGGGETLGSDLLAGWDFTSGWFIIGAATIVDQNSFTNTGAGGLYLPHTFSSFNMLAQFTIAGSTTAPTFSSHNNNGSAANLIISDFGSAYFIPTFNGIYLRHSTTSTTDITELFIKQVLTPSATGATITSTKNGTTYNWEYQDASFNYNDASGYTYQIIDRDLSAFCDGNHSIEVYDSTGKFIRGVLGAAGSGETLGSELVVNGDFSSTDGWSQYNGASIASNVCTLPNSGSYIRRAAPISFGYLLCLSGEVNTISAGDNIFFYTSNYNVGGNVKATSTGSVSGYMTNNGISGQATIYKENANGSGEVDNFSLKQVLTPSTSGCTIVSAKGGATQNFSYKNAGFAYNASSYVCIIKRLRG